MIQHPNYVFQNILGQSGMVTVLLAKHNLIHQMVAIKVLNNEFVHNENICKRFLMQAFSIFKLSYHKIMNPKIL